MLANAIAGRLVTLVLGGGVPLTAARLLVAALLVLLVNGGRRAPRGPVDHLIPQG